MKSRFRTQEEQEEIDKLRKSRHLQGSAVDLPDGSRIEWHNDYNRTPPPCLTKGWKFMTFVESEFRLWLSIRGLTYSKNWSMGSLNIDLFSVSLHLGKREFYMVYRVHVTPPKTFSVKDFQI